MAEPILACRDLTFRYDGELVFEHLSLSVEPGEAVLLMGPSGCGKSSLAYCLSGLYPAYGGELSGEITLECRPLSQYEIADRAQVVSILFQNPDNQFCMDRVDHEILFALENINYTGDLKARMRQLLAMVGLEKVETALIHTLSGGTKQKLALATALATGARMLILDEPFANLDPGACAQLSEQLRQLNRQGLTLLVVDHRPDYWRPFLSRVLMMNKDGSLEPGCLLPDELEAHRAEFEARGLFLDDQWLERRRPLPLPQPEAAAVEGEDVSLVYVPQDRGLWSVLPVSQGGVTALVGRNGSGKTSLLTAIAGAGGYKGRLRVEGPAGLVFQNPRFQFLSLSVEEEVLTTLRAARPKADPSALSAQAEELLEEFGLLPWRKHSPYALSQGQQRRLALLAMLAGEQPLLLLDEPTYAQDQRATAFILDLLERRVANGLTAVIATHDLTLARRCANVVYLLEDGRMEQMTPEDLDCYAKERGVRPVRKLNPAWKLLTLIIASLMLSVTYNTRLNLITAGICLLVTVCTPKVNRKLLALSMIPFLIAAFGMFMTGVLFPSEGVQQGVEMAAFGQRVIYANSLTSAMQLASRVLVYGGLGMLFAFTTNSMDLIMSLMQQFHLPPKFAYGILAAYHFFPVVRSEFGTVGTALKVRGIKTLPFSPKRLLPMLVHALERSESLAMAMESRGFQEGRPRAVAFRVAFGWIDIAFFIGLPAALLAGRFLL